MDHAQQRDKAIVAAIRSTVAYPALSQSIKGIVTAGVGKSVRYALAKLSKYIK
jgi:translocator assembly and maintenance protein 41